MNLWMKIQETVPGKLAVALGEVRYDHGSKFTKEEVDVFSQAQAYLEKLAIEELSKREPWALELAAKQTAQEKP